MKISLLCLFMTISTFTHMTQTYSGLVTSGAILAFYFTLIVCDATLHLLYFSLMGPYAPSCYISLVKKYEKNIDYDLLIKISMFHSPILIIDCSIVWVVSLNKQMRPNPCHCSFSWTIIKKNNLQFFLFVFLLRKCLKPKTNTGCSEIDHYITNFDLKRKHTRL